MKHITPHVGRGAHRDVSKERFWRRAMRRFAAGGQSVREFCKSGDLSEASFYFWRRTLVERDAAVSPMTARASAPAFVPVRITHPTLDAPRACPEPVEGAGPEPGRMEIVLSGGRRIRLHGPVDCQVLADVLSVLVAMPSGDPITPEADSPRRTRREAQAC